MVEMEDTGDLRSPGGNTVRVRVLPRALIAALIGLSLFLASCSNTPHSYQYNQGYKFGIQNSNGGGWYPGMPDYPTPQSYCEETYGLTNFFASSSQDESDYVQGCVDGIAKSGNS